VVPDRALVVLAAVLGLSGVAAGAFGAHAMGADPRAVDLLRTGASYALWHALAMLACRALGLGRAAPALFGIGACLFSFSLYALALGAPRAVALATPFGGTALLAGWVALAVAGLRGRLRGP
jgi:uncharacterized membrane protein YgdD (TMEM256/DUF423 family)